MDFAAFPKIARLSRNCTVTEKIDGTNAQVFIDDDGHMYFGSRTRWITPQNDNYGFASWGTDHADELMLLGPGHHFGEWWGQGIQRKYGLTEKRFSLFNVGKWNPDNAPSCCHVVPILYQGEFDTTVIRGLINAMAEQGSRAVPGWMDPEGIVVFHEAAGIMFKKTIKGDESPKSKLV